MLEQSDIAHYLLSLGVVNPRSVIEEDLTVVDVSRRNSVFLVRSRGPAHVVKQGDRATLAHEAGILRLLAGAPAVAPHVPAVVHHDDALLVLRTPGGARDWSDHRGRFPRIPARVLGRLLARLHGLETGAPAAPGPIWGLLLPEPPHELVLELSTGAQEVVARLQSSRAMCERLERLREEVRRDVLVHGDLRWENCLALPAPGARRRTRVLLVDWELAGRSDAAFDAGTVLAEYLRVWVGSIPIVRAGDPSALLHHARHPLREMQPAMRAFWSAYRSAASAPPPLRRVAELTGVRVLQIAVEQAQGLSEMSQQVLATLQLAGNLLGRPDDGLAMMGLRA